MEQSIKLFNIMPVVMPLCVFIIILASIIKNEKLKDILLKLGLISLCLSVFILMGIAAPWLFLSSMFEIGEGILIVLLFIIVVWGIVSWFIDFINIYLIQKNKIKEIYIRDVNVMYSPAVLSYLMNNKIETGKDLSATLLNLCAKNILKLEKTTNEKIKIIDLKNEKNVLELKPDDKYAYKMLVEGITINKITRWKNIVKDEYAKYKFSKKHTVPLAKYIFLLNILFYVVNFIYFVISGNSVITGVPAEILVKAMVVLFVSVWEMILFWGVAVILKSLSNKNDNSGLNMLYTKKGAKEYNKWKRFEKFIEEFSSVDEQEHESIVIWGEYLAYSIALGINKKCDKKLFKKIDKTYLFNYDFFSKKFSNKEE